MFKRFTAGILAVFLNQMSAVAERPSVVMISIDDLNDWTGLLGGHPQGLTPNMDALAARGRNFINAHFSASLFSFSD